jgi:hypothetical protein
MEKEDRKIRSLHITYNDEEPKEEQDTKIREIVEKWMKEHNHVLESEYVNEQGVRVMNIKSNGSCDLH